MKLAKGVGLLVVALMGSAQARGAGCDNLAGNWAGTCQIGSGAPTPIALEISQNQCDQVQIFGRVYFPNGRSLARENQSGATGDVVVTEVAEWGSAGGLFRVWQNVFARNVPNAAVSVVGPTINRMEFSLNSSGLQYVIISNGFSSVNGNVTSTSLTRVCQLAAQ